MNKIEQAKKLKPLAVAVGRAAKPVGQYVYHRRGRFSALGTVVALYPLIKRPHHTWQEFEKDFRMYDELNARKKSKQSA
jgi:hypothetical protein